MGLSFSPDITFRSNSNDRSSVCDEYINPRALSIPACTAPDRGRGDGWQAAYDRDHGWVGGLELGYRWRDVYRVAVSLSRTETDFGQTVSSTNASGADFEKLSNELAAGRETLDQAAATDLFLWLYRDFAFAPNWSAGLGLGAGVSKRALKIGWNWSRSQNPEDISTGRDQPNFDEIRRNLAGTRSLGRATIRDDLWGFGVSASLERRLRADVRVGLRAEWRSFGRFRSEPYTGDLLRDHPPNLRLDGSEPVTAWSRTKDTKALNVLVFVRHSF